MKHRRDPRRWDGTQAAALLYSAAGFIALFGAAVMAR